MPSCSYECRNGEAVQVEPMKSNLKVPGTKRLKVKYDNLLSRLASKINLRRYTTGRCITAWWWRRGR